MRDCGVGRVDGISCGFCFFGWWGGLLGRNDGTITPPYHGYCIYYSFPQRSTHIPSNFRLIVLLRKFHSLNLYFADKFWLPNLPWCPLISLSSRCFRVAGFLAFFYLKTCRCGLLSYDSSPHHLILISTIPFSHPLHSDYIYRISIPLHIVFPSL